MEENQKREEEREGKDKRNKEISTAMKSDTNYK